MCHCNIIISCIMKDLQLCRLYHRKTVDIDILSEYYLLTNLTSNNTGNEDKTKPVGWFEIVLPVICVLGLIGNLMNIIVLTRQRLLSRMDRLEKSAIYGLTALAFSDMMFCVMVFPHCFIEHHGSTTDKSNVYKLYYRLYGVGAINTFLMTSTWLIVYMAVSRFIVVVYPFQARRFLATSRGIVIIILIYLTSVVLTLPFILHLQIGPCLAYASVNSHTLLGPSYINTTHLNLSHDLSRDDNVITHAVTLYEFRTALPRNVTRYLRFYINWVWPVVADCVPLFILLTLNVRLIKELQLAESRRRISCRGQSVRNNGGQTLTLTLVVIVLMLFFLVTPSEMLRYVNPYKLWGKTAYLIVSITNVLQVLNFAFNFVLYCVVSASFRKTAKSVFQCCFPSFRLLTLKETLGTDITIPTDSVRRNALLSPEIQTNNNGLIQQVLPMTNVNNGDVRFLTYG